MNRPIKDEELIDFIKAKMVGVVGGIEIYESNNTRDHEA